jgi:hypothetical protein
MRCPQAWMPGVVTHRDVLHAYAIVFMVRVPPGAFERPQG